MTNENIRLTRDTFSLLIVNQQSFSLPIFTILCDVITKPCSERAIDVIAVIPGPTQGNIASWKTGCFKFLSPNTQPRKLILSKEGFWWGRIGLDLRLNFTIRRGAP